MVLKKIIIKSTIALVAIALTSGCGGGGGGTSATLAKFNTLSVLSNGQGVGRGVADDGSQLLIYSHEITEIIAGANAAASGSIVDLNASDFPITGVNSTSTTRAGTIISGGITFNVRTIENNATSNAAAIFIETPGYADLIMVTGEAYLNPPLGGIYNYTGTQTSNARSVVAPGSIGTFRMGVDFTANTFSYSGSSGNLTLNASGVLDKINGRFATSSASITAGGLYYTGTMHGLLHGSGATSTSGLFHTNDIAPDYSGAFVGSR
jgi:hypothetical protein